MSNEEFVSGIEYPEPFHEYAVQLCNSATRHICILSPSLDHAAFNHADLVDALSQLARRSRQTQIRLLVSDTRGIVSRSHRLLQLSRRLPSTIHLQKLAEHPDWNWETLVIRDRDGVLYKPGDSDSQAFYEPASRASTQRHLELFEELWRHSTKDPELRSFHL